MALIEMRVEKEHPHFNPEFCAKDLADMLGVSTNRLTRLFRNQTMHRTPDAYIENLRTLAALKLLRDKPNYTLVAIAEETGFSADEYVDIDDIGRAVDIYVNLLDNLII